MASKIIIIMAVTLLNSDAVICDETLKPIFQLVRSSLDNSDLDQNLCKYLFYLVAYLSSYHEKAINALYELA